MRRTSVRRWAARCRRNLAMCANRDDGHQHRGDELLVGAAHNEHLARTDNDRTAGPHHASAGKKAVALGRGEEVDLVLDRQYFSAGRRYIIAAPSTVPGFGLHA